MRHADRKPSGRFAAAAAFTITELLVVIVIITLVLAIAVPSFTAIIYSQESTLSQTRLATALRTARDAALQSTGGADTAAVFFFDPGGRLRIVTCIKAGELLDKAGSAGGTGGAPGLVQREIFVPLSTLEPVELPRNWMVRGYIPAFTLNTAGSWYEANSAGIRYGGTAGEAAWVFPETGFYNDSFPAPDEGKKRQTFMVRFQAGSGVMSPTTASEVLVLSPRKSSQNRPQGVNDLWKRADRATDYQRFVRRILNEPAIGFPRADNERQELLGDESADTVLARPVWMLGVYDERKLAAALGASLDRATGCLYQDPLQVREPRFVEAAGRSSPDIGRSIAQWMNGKTRLVPGQAPTPPQVPPSREDGDVPEARIYTIDRFTGEVRPVEVDL